MESYTAAEKQRVSLASPMLKKNKTEIPLVAVAFVLID